MCTAVGFKPQDFYFGRTLDYDCTYGEDLVILPRKFPIHFRHLASIDSHYALLGVAHVAEGYPLFYDAVNEKGLAMAGLNFDGNAVYGKPKDGKTNVAQFEFILWLLTRCANISEAREHLGNLQITDTPFSQNLPVAPLHWIISDKDASIVVEATADGLHVYDDPVGVLTNNPIFPMQMFHLNNFMHLSARDPENLFSKDLPLSIYSRGMGGLGLPGDLSSQSRFVRAAFTKENSLCGRDEGSSVSQFFHILGSVSQSRGCCQLPNGKQEVTIYTSCYNCRRGILYYTAYDRPEISALHLHGANLDTAELYRYPMKLEGDIHQLN